MKLTDKCKEDFLTHNNITEQNLLFGYSEREINALIIEFFDSVGIFIFIEHTSYFSVLKFEAKVITNDDFIILNRHEKRSEAINESIIHANKIYNEKMP